MVQASGSAHPSQREGTVTTRAAETAQAALAFATAVAVAMFLGVTLLAAKNPEKLPAAWAATFGPAVVCGLVVGGLVVPVWRLVAAGRPSFPRGATAGLVTTALAAGVAFATLALLVFIKDQKAPADPQRNHLGGPLLFYFLLGVGSVVALPVGVVFGGLVGHVQQRRAWAMRDGPDEWADD